MNRCQVTLKSIDLTGERFEGEQVRVLGIEYMSADRQSGSDHFRLSVFEGSSHFCVFAPKSAFADVILALKQAEFIDLAGTVVGMNNGGYALFVDQITSAGAPIDDQDDDDDDDFEDEDEEDEGDEGDEDEGEENEGEEDGNSRLGVPRNGSMDLSDSVERLERFEERLGCRLENLSAFVEILSTSIYLTVRGELHAREGNQLAADVRLVIAAYNSGGRVVGTGSEDFAAEAFFGFETFETTVRLPVKDVARVRVHPKRG